MKSDMRTIVWLREDLRLFDNPALHHGASVGTVVPVFIYPEGLGRASYWWLHHSLEKLMLELKQQGVELILRKGKPEEVLHILFHELGANKVVWYRVYSPLGIKQGKLVKDSLGSANTQSFNGQLLIEPTQILNKQNLPFKVFTPFWRHCQRVLDPSPLLKEIKLTGCSHSIKSDELLSWGLLPYKPDWSEGLAKRWQPGEQGAQNRWEHFLESTVNRYKEGRDFPSKDNTSYLSPHLAFGEISTKQIWFDLQQAMASNEIDLNNAAKFLSEIGWREFSRYLLVHFPHIEEKPFNQKFTDFPWQNRPDLLLAWQKGLTGYPIVDAGMRELWETGYMHNRVRMVAASFLTKHCLTHWHEGMSWFWDTLVDADIANNTASWQWVSGCGADAAPYFRIFNPILQGERFDKQGDYIKKWVPELSELAPKFIHKPWEADQATRALAGVSLGDNYPWPVVDHKQARQEALDAYQAIRTNG